MEWRHSTARSGFDVCWWPLISFINKRKTPGDVCLGAVIKVTEKERKGKKKEKEERKEKEKEKEKEKGKEKEKEKKKKERKKCFANCWKVLVFLALRLRLKVQKTG